METKLIYVKTMQCHCCNCQKVIPIARCFACEWCMEKYACSLPCWKAVSVRHSLKCKGKHMMVAHELGLMPTHDYRGNLLIATNIPEPVDIGAPARSKSPKGRKSKKPKQKSPKKQGDPMKRKKSPKREESPKRETIIIKQKSVEPLHSTVPTPVRYQNVGARVHGSRGGGGGGGKSGKGRVHGSRYPGQPSKAKAKEILHHGTIGEHPISEKQRRFFGWIASR